MKRQPFHKHAIRRFCLLFAFTGVAIIGSAQSGFDLSAGQVHGDVEVIMQQYNQDSLIRAAVPDASTAMNAFGNIIYTNGPVTAGLRFESYLNRLEGYPDRFKGTGLGYRYVSFKQDIYQVTVGNFYEQFGMGSILRIWEQRQLGVDNALDGVLVKANPWKGIYIKGLYGKQRVDFQDRLINGDGLVRGVDGSVSINELFDSLNYTPWRLSFGASFVSKYQPDDDAVLNLPENVGAWAYRMNYLHGNFGLQAEYAYKINDPSNDNNYIYKPGQSLMLNARYSTKGFGIVLDYKYSDNMSFRSDRADLLTNATIGFMPALTRPHTYNLAATLYPYNVQWSETAFQANISYLIPRKSVLGGKYGTQITLNYAVAHGLDTTLLNDVSTDPGAERMGYTSKFGIFGPNKYYQDFNVEIKRKFNEHWKATIMYLNIVYNNDINQGAYNNDGQAPKGIINANIAVLDVAYKFKRKHNIRMELQGLWTGRDKSGELQHQGHWVTGLIEYTYSPHWFVAILDQYNFGNPDPVYRLHYLLGSVGYIQGSSRISLSYGRQREGLFCVGGVCRTVPASNGFTLTFNTTF